MKKGLILTLATVAVALLSTVVYGYAPIISSIPDVWIGDSEDNIVGPPPVDLNFFRFTNAFNFDQYVTKDPLDEDQSTSNVRWSFLADSADLVTINGLESLSDASEALKPELVGKELTSYPNNDTPPRATSLATFRDILDSPTTSSPPYPSPTSGSELNTVIAIYASNGTKASSKPLVVRANLIDGIDKLSGVGLVKVYEDLTPSADWTKLYPTDGQFINAFDGAFYIATQTTDGGSIGASGHATNSVWSYWNAPATAMSYVANQVYRAKYTIRTTQTNPLNVPNIRMLLQCTDGVSAAFAGGNRLGKGPSAPTTTPQAYSVYFGPMDLSTLIPAIQYVSLSWELIDFATDESGTNYLDSVVVERFATPDKAGGTPVATFQGASGFAGWTSFKLTENPPGTPFYGNVTFAGGGASTSVSIQTPGPVEASTHINWGQWSIGATSGVTFEASKLYRTVYTLSANSQSLGKLRLINNTVGGQWSAELDADSNAFTAQMPTPGGVEYNVWQESMPTLYSGADVAKNGMTFLFDISDGRADQSGTTVLSKVEVLSYSIP